MKLIIKTDQELSQVVNDAIKESGIKKTELAEKVGLIRQGLDKLLQKRIIIADNRLSKKSCSLERHCEGIETEELYFVHRTIYEYFVVETIYSSIENAMEELSDKSQEELAGNIAVYLKKGWITKTIGGYFKWKIMKFY